MLKIKKGMGRVKNELQIAAPCIFCDSSVMKAENV